MTRKIIKEMQVALSLAGNEFTDSDLQSFIDSGTIIVSKSKDRVVLLCLFSIHGDVAHVHEMYVDPDFRHKNAIKWTAIKGLTMFPFLNEIVFERERKYPDRAPRKYDLYRLIGVKRHSEVKNG